MENLTIGYDAKRAVCNGTGLGNYSRLVIDLMSGYLYNSKLLLYSPVANNNKRLSPLLKRDNVNLVTPSGITGNMFPSIWRVGGGITNQIKSDKVDLFHGFTTVH